VSATPEEPGDDAATTALGRGVAGAAVGARYAGHHLVDVPSAAGRRGLAARRAPYWSAHGGSVPWGRVCGQRASYGLGKVAKASPGQR